MGLVCLTHILDGLRIFFFDPGPAHLSILIKLKFKPLKY